MSRNNDFHKERRGFLKLVAKSVAVAPVIGALGSIDLLVSGCSGSNFQDTTPIERTRNNQAYVILIDYDQDLKEVSETAGYDGEYGHVALVYKGMAYGVSTGQRVGKGREIALEDLEDLLKGCAYEIFELDLKNPRRAIQYFASVVKGEEFANSADMIVKMCNGSSNPLTKVHPILLDTPEKTNFELMDALISRDIPIPKNGVLYLPEQFKTAGFSYGKGVFGTEAQKR